MGDGNHCAVFELFPHYTLNGSICFRINSSRCFVHDNNFGSMQQSPCNHQQLTLADTKITSTFGHIVCQRLNTSLILRLTERREAEAGSTTGDCRFVQAYSAKNLIEFLIIVITKRVQICPHCARVQNWILWNDCNTGSKFGKPNLTRVLTIDIDISFGQFNNSKHSHHQGRFASASATHHANFASSRDIDIKPLQNQGGRGSVSKLCPLNLNLSTGGPTFWQRFVDRCLAIALAL
mmetsp:Transcript_5144/g.9194  ORF Transcript_5144/g.9194 Transcript_5144/m.9194 type:complete len:236 (+) Transcript_5144:1106-1813(+)